MRNILLSALLLASNFLHAQVKIGDNAGSINPASLFELESTNKGLLIPRLTVQNRNGIGAPPDGLLIYNKSTDELNIYNNSAWQTIPNSFTFNYITTDLGQTLASNGTIFQPDNFILNRLTYVMIGYQPSDNFSSIDTLMINGNIRIGKDATWTSAATNRAIKFGDGSYTTIGEELGDDKLVFRGKNFSFLPSSTNIGTMGIGTSDPQAALHVTRGFSSNGTAEFDGTTYPSYFNYQAAEDTYIRGGKAASKVIINDASTGNVSIAMGGGNVGIGITTPAARLDINGTIKISGGSPDAGKVLTCTDATGLASWQALPAQPVLPQPVYFKATSSIGTNAVNNALNTLHFATEDMDNSGSYDPATSTFAAPSSGVYYFQTQVTFPSNYTGAVDLRFYVGLQLKASLDYYVVPNASFTLTPHSISLSSLLSLIAGDLVTVQINQISGDNVIVGDNGLTNYFMGYKIN